MTMLAEYGTLSRKDILEPSIEMAEGYPMEADTVRRIEANKKHLKKWKYSRDVMLPNLGKDHEAADEVLATLALDARPLPDPADLVGLLEVAAIDREIADLKQQLQRMDRDTEEQRYSELLQTLIAWEQRKRERRNDAR